uniref:Amino acid transporter transmembrane domain-containing protein n=1 Tax=Fagus sylvatica TaxID=28930 RepID=A0A2N9IGD4_FAGSY
MDSTYSSIPKSTFLESQSDNHSQNPNPRSPPKTHVKLLPLHEEEGGGFLPSSKNAGDNDDGDIDLDLAFDNYPLIDDDAGSKTGSGISGAVFNLTTSIIGAGIMALPAAMKVLGLVLGFVMIILMGVLTEISVELWVRFSVLCKASSSYTVRLCNTRWGGQLGCSVHHVGVFDQWLGKGVWDQRMLVIMVVLVVFLAPLCFLQRIESLSLTSAASVALAVLFVVVACVIASIKLVEGRIETPRLGPDFGSKKAILDLLVVIPIMMNAYVCHFSVQPIYNELEGRSPQKMNLVGRITTLVCVVVYALTAISGYLLFGEGTESDVLTNFDKDLGIRFSSALNYIIRVGYILHLVLVFPVVHFSLRQAVDALVFAGSAPLIESRKRSLVLTAVLLLLIYFGSTMIPNIWTVFKFTGATTAVSLGFIFPPLVALRLSQLGGGLSFSKKFLSWLMLILAIVVGVVGVLGNVYSIESQSK